MKIPYLPIVVMASALSLASANAMPDLGRETGKFIRKDASVPKDVRSFAPAESAGSKTEKDLAMRRWQPEEGNIRLAITMPTHPSIDRLAITMPTHPSSRLA